MKAYQRAATFDTNNYAVVRDLSYMQLHLRQYKEFRQSAYKAIEIKSDLPVNWIALSLSGYMSQDYTFALKVLDNCVQLLGDNVKPIEINYIQLFKIICKLKEGNHKETLSYLAENEDKITDKRELAGFYKQLYWALGDKESYLKKVEEELAVNSENLTFVSEYLKAHGIEATSIESIINSTDAKVFSLIEELSTKFPKSRLIKNLQFGLTPIEEFLDRFNKYLKSELISCNTAIFVNIKFIYRYQADKVNIIESVIRRHLESIRENKTLAPELVGDLHLVPYLDWLKYFAAQHFSFKGQTEQALVLIDEAINSTLTVIDFYEVKSRILKQSRQFEMAAKCYEKARTLDRGDRYLNARTAKINLVGRNVDAAREVMKDFIKDPMTPENVEYYQCLWFEEEVAKSYAKQLNMKEALRFINYSVNHLFEYFDDQFDFQNWCMRRYVLKHFVESIEFFDRFYDNKRAVRSLFLLNLVRLFWENNGDEARQHLADGDEDHTAKYKELFNNVDKMLKKMQNCSKNPAVHLFAVQFYIHKNKPLVALKSLRILKKLGGREFWYGLKDFNSYLKERSGFEELVRAHCDFLDEKTQEPTKETLKDLINLLWSRFGSIKDEVSDLIEEAEKKEVDELRRLGRKTIEKLEMMAIVVGLEEKFVKVFDKLKISTEEELQKNLHMFEVTPEAIVKFNKDYCEKNGIEYVQEVPKKENKE